MKEIRLFASIHIDDFLESLTQSTAGELIKQIDLSMADYSFTNDMAKHFISELIKECDASGEEFDINELMPKKKKGK